MKSLIALSTLALTLSLSSNSGQLSIGDKAPEADRVLKGTRDKALSLNDVKGENGVCVIFSCNTCPYVIGWENRYNDLSALCKKNDIGFMLVNSNEAKRGGDDSPEAMAAHAKEKGYGDFPYLIDTDHVLADAFGATKTPDVFLFNGNMELVYKGAIDDNMKNMDAVKEAYLSKAVSDMVAGKPCDPSETKAIGCTIKRKS